MRTERKKNRKNKSSSPLPEKNIRIYFLYNIFHCRPYKKKKIKPEYSDQVNATSASIVFHQYAARMLPNNRNFQNTADKTLYENVKKRTKLLSVFFNFKNYINEHRRPYGKWIESNGKCIVFKKFCNKIVCVLKRIWDRPT